MWNNHMTKALPCINTQQTAAKTISKDQQTLVLTGEKAISIDKAEQFSPAKLFESKAEVKP